MRFNGTFIPPKAPNSAQDNLDQQFLQLYGKPSRFDSQSKTLGEARRRAGKKEGVFQDMGRTMKTLGGPANGNQRS